MAADSTLDLEALEAAVRAELDGKFAARELALKNCRRIIQGSSKAIRALHRGELEGARTLLDEVRAMMAQPAQFTAVAYAVLAAWLRA